MSNPAKLTTSGPKWARALLLAAFIALPGVSHSFHFPWDQGHDTTDWQDPNEPGPCGGSQCDECGARSPVNVSTGHFLWQEVDIVIAGSPGLTLTRSYNSNDPRDGMFGRGWSSNCDHALLQFVGSEFDSSSSVVGASGYVFRAANGKRYTFKRDANGAIVPPAGRFERVEELAGGGLRLTSPDGGARSFDGSGRLTSISSANGASIAYEYATDGRLQRMTTVQGRSLAFSYNSSGRVQSVTDQTNRAWQYGYDSDGNLTSVTDPAGGVRTYEYGSYTPAGDGHTYHQLTEVRDATDVVVTSVTYLNDRVASYTHGADQFRYAYNPVQRSVTKTDSVGSQWVFTYDAAGRITTERDPINNTRRHEYDANGRKVRYTDAANQVWNWTYDAQGRMTTATNPLQVQTTWQYEGTSWFATRINLPLGRSIQFAYDARNLPTRIVDSGGAATDYTWSAAGHLQRIQNALGGQINVATDAIGRPSSATDAVGRATGMAYDSLGRLLTATNAANQSSSLEYDALGRVSAQIHPGGSRTSFGYDAAGRLTSMTDPAGRIHRYEFDTHGRLAAQVASDGRREAYRYRTDNQLSEKVRADGSIERYQYDAAKRLTQIVAGAQVYNYGYDARGALTSASNPVSNISRVFDSIGRLTSETVNGRTVSYTYNDADEVLSVMTPLGTASYQRDARGSITSMTAPEGEYRFVYDALGRRTSLTYPNGQAVAYGYDAAHQLERLAYSGLFNAEFTYTYDLAGRAQTDSSAEGVWSYSYDGRGRLSRATRGAIDMGFQYDAAGNLLHSGATIDAANRLTETATHTFTYDAHGNLLTKQDRTSGARVVYHWNESMELVRVDRYANGTATTPTSSVSFAYDALRRRMQRTANGVTEVFIHDRANRIGSVNTAGGPIERITHSYRGDEPLAITYASGSSRYLHADRLGSVIAVSGGAQVDRLAYLPYGQAAAVPGVQVPFRFTGHEYEADDLYYFRARYYDPQLGRFISEDPLGVDAGLNLYAYVDGDPVNYKDFSGKYTVAIGIGIRIVGGRAAGAAIGAGLGRVLGPTAGAVVACVLLAVCSTAEEADEPAPQAPPADRPSDTPEPKVCPVPLPDDPAQNPWPGVGEWRGKEGEAVGGDKGAWVNPETGEQLHPDLNHGPPYGPHWDYKDPAGDRWRVDPGSGIMTPK
jgi:RHS repeat-associated protein